MKRGDFITVVMQGAYGKPRPALVIQADFFDEHDSVTFLPVTSDIMEGVPTVRVTVMPNPDNGLQKPSQVMVDKVMTLPRSKCGEAFGVINASAMKEVERRLAIFLGIAK